VSAVTAEVVVPCFDLDAEARFFLELGFTLERLQPADDPSLAWLSRHGLRLRLERGAAVAPPTLRLAGDGPRSLTAPGGTRVEVAPPVPDLVVPPLASSFVLQRVSDADAWGVGRAGMRYRDLIPDRQGGRFIASHIAVADGPVPDAVHYHLVRFQLIFCVAGRVRVVYQDQGPPFWLEPGDCVLQAPAIRHRVLEAQGGLEVLELGCPAVHATCFDPELELPTPDLRPERDFGGQRFTRHVAREAGWAPSWRAGYEARDAGLGAASGGRVELAVLHGTGTADGWDRHDGELLFGFVLAGVVTLEREGAAPERLATHDAFVVPAGLSHALRAPDDLELLEVRVPALHAV